MDPGERTPPDLLVSTRRGLPSKVVRCNFLKAIFTEPSDRHVLSWILSREAKHPSLWDAISMATAMVEGVNSRTC